MTVRLLHYSDVENAYDDSERVGRLAGCIESRRDEATLVVGSGDDTGPGVLSLVERGGQALDFFDAVDPDAETFGNHDFDHGLNRTRELVAASPQPWVSANVYAGDDAEGATRDDAPDARFGSAEGVVPWTVADAGDARVGFVGVTTPHTPEMNPETDGLVFADPAESVREHLPALRERADHVVVLAHLADCEPLADLPGVDAVLAGHTHDFEVEWVGETPVVRQSNNGRHLAELELRPDGEPTAKFHAVAEAPVRDGVAEALSARVADAGLDEVVAAVDDPVERTEEAAFCGESRLGNFVADAYRWATGADVGLQNSGGVRTGDPLEGEITAADVVSVTPFEERVVVAAVPGAALREAFEWAAGPDLDFAEPDWWHAQVSGAEVVWDPDACTVESVSVGGRPLDPDRTYEVALSDYVLHTDDEFPSLRESYRVERHDIQYEVLVKYAREVGEFPVVEGRVTET